MVMTHEFWSLNRAMLILQVRENGIELMTLEEIISGDETYGTGT